MQQLCNCQDLNWDRRRGKPYERNARKGSYHLLASYLSLQIQEEGDEFSGRVLNRCKRVYKSDVDRLVC